MRHALTLIVLLGGCAQWEELPEGATGFLAVHNATLDGTFAGVRVEGAASRATGYCTSSGWMMELRARGEDGGVVMSAVDIRDLWFGSDTTAVFRADDAERSEARMELESSTGELDDPWGTAVPASAYVEGCAGETNDEWTVEERAEVAIVDVETIGWTGMRVTYEAQFPSGDTVQGSFDAQMPLRD